MEVESVLVTDIKITPLGGSFRLSYLVCVYPEGVRNSRKLEGQRTEHYVEWRLSPPIKLWDKMSPDLVIQPFRHSRTRLDGAKKLPLVKIKAEDLISLCSEGDGTRKEHNEKLDSFQVTVGVRSLDYRNMGEVMLPTAQCPASLQLLRAASAHLNTVVKILGGISENLPITSAAVSALATLSMVVETHREFGNDLEDLIIEMCDFLTILDESGQQERIGLLQCKAAAIMEMIKQASECMTDHISKRILNQFFDAQIRRSKLDNFKKAFARLRRDCVEEATLQTSYDVSNLRNALQGPALREVGTRDHLKTLDRLRRVHDAAYDGVKTCLDGTRIEILQDLMSWACNTHPEGPRIYWLRGQAGMGKSTISATFAKTLREENKLGGEFFFSRSVPDRKGTQGVFTSIAYQLAIRMPLLKDLICDAIEAEPSIGYLAASTQWKSLIKGPLLKAAGYLELQGTFIIILDALDECTSPFEIIENIESDILSLPPNFKLFCTSRPEVELETTFKSMGDTVLVRGLSASDENVTRDIRIFVLERMKSIAQTYRLDNVYEWPGKESREALVRRAEGLFIYVTTVTNFIDDREVSDPNGQLQIVLCDIVDPSATLTSPWIQLDSLYYNILRKKILENSTQFFQRLYRSVVGAIVTVIIPLSVSALVQLLDIQDHGPNTATRLVNRTIGRIQAVLFLPQSDDDVIKTIHKSFAECLTSSERCTEKTLFIDPKVQHQCLSARCLQLMDDHLTLFDFDLDPSLLNSEIDDLESRFLDKITSALRYGCIFWAEHLHYAEPENNLLCLVKSFYSKHLLCWFEMLSLIGHGDTAVRSLNLSYQWLKLYYPNEEDLLALAQDSLRFAMEFQYPIRESAAHVRYSALPLAPQSLPVYKTYASQIKSDSVKISYGPPSVWPRWSTVMDGHRDFVHSVAFSPEGDRIVSGSEDMEIRLWDAASGAAIGRAFDGHKGIVTGVVFEPDGKNIISGSQDGTLRRWNVASGDPVGQPFEGHEKGVTSVALASNGGEAMVISGSLDSTIRLWNVMTGKAIRVIKCDPTTEVTAVAISPDRTQIVSGSTDRSVQIWSVTSGKACGRPLRGHTKAVCSVTFSPDGNTIVSSSEDGTLCVWDAKSINPIPRVLRGHVGPVYSVAFSPDGKLIGSGSLDATVQLWDALSGEPVGQVWYTEAVVAVVFSPDSKAILGAGYDFTIRGWDVEEAMMTDKEFRDTSEGIVLSAKFSQDGRQIVMGFTSGAIEVMDAKKHTSKWKINGGHSGPVYSATFSSDDSLILSSSYDKTVRQWDAETGEEVRVPLTGRHTARVFCAAYSSDAKRIVSGSQDQTVRLWDAESGQEIEHLSISHDDNVYCCGFSPRGDHVASGSRDRSLKIWDINTGQVVKEVANETGAVTSIEYSPDGKQILATSIDGRAIYWNRETDSRKETDIFTQSILYDLEEGWLKNLNGRRMIWLPSEYRLDFRPGVYNKHLLVTPNPSRQEKVTIFDLSPMIEDQEIRKPEFLTPALKRTSRGWAPQTLKTRPSLAQLAVRFTL